jgi:membrane protease YdiL (CAAX protease family)
LRVCHGEDERVSSHGEYAETRALAPHGVDPQFAAWLLAVIALTGGSVLWLRHDHVNILKDFAWQVPLIGYSPLLAALIAIALWRGRGALALRTSLLKWRVGVHWYALVVGFPLLLMLVAHFIVDLKQGEFPHWPVANWLAPVGALGALLSGSIGEEIGWRGFAQPLLQKRAGALGAAVVLGVIWGIWHLNAELTTSQPLAAFLNDAPRSLLRMVSTAILYGWLYVRTGGSLPVVMLAHAGHNIAVDVLPFTDAPEGGGLPLTVISSLYALAALPAAWSLWRERARYR